MSAKVDLEVLPKDADVATDTSIARSSSDILPQKVQPHSSTALILSGKCKAYKFYGMVWHHLTFLLNG